MTPSGTNVVDACSEGGSSGGGLNGGCGLKKGPWTAEEDAILVEYVKKHGEGNWNAVQRNSGLARCGKSCRLRWANHLRPNLKKGAFSPEEERLIVELHAKYGNKWARMASLLPGRTDNEIKNYWNTRVKRHQRQGIPLYPADLQPQQQQASHYHHHHHLHQSSLSTPTTPTSSFSFQTQLSTPTTPSSHPYHPHHPHHQLSPTPPPLSPHSYGSNSFTFQTQMSSPLHHHPHHLVASSAPISPISPLSSPSTNNNSNGYSTLTLFDFSAPRTPPVLQAPLRFKRFPSAPTIVNASNNNSMPSPTSFSLPLSPLTSPNMAGSGGSNGGGFTGLLSSTSSDFHKNLQEENEKMCSLFAAVSQELPSSQIMPNSSPMHNMGIGIGSKLIGRRINKKKNGFISKDRQGNHGIAMAKNGLLEDLLRDAKVFGGQSSNNLLLQDQNNIKVFDFDGFGSNWDNSNSLSLSSGFEAKVEATSQTNTTTSEDLNKLLDTMPSTLHVEFNDSGEISNGQSSVITDDNIGFDMQQIASLFPTTTDHDRNLGTCSWDNLPRIC